MIGLIVTPQKAARCKLATCCTVEAFVVHVESSIHTVGQARWLDKKTCGPSCKNIGQQLTNQRFDWKMIRNKMKLAVLMRCILQIEHPKRRRKIIERSDATLLFIGNGPGPMGYQY